VKWMAGSCARKLRRLPRHRCRHNPKLPALFGHAWHIKNMYKAQTFGRLCRTFTLCLIKTPPRKVEEKLVNCNLETAGNTYAICPTHFPIPFPHQSVIIANVNCQRLWRSPAIECLHLPGSQLLFNAIQKPEGALQENPCHLQLQLYS